MASTMTAIHPVPYANRASETTANGGSSSAQPSTISANDFLMLLVTEMKNQDPTAQTDPNQYINQLVQVNSLQQLIQINEELSTAAGEPGSGGSGGASGHAIKSVLSGMSAPPAQTSRTHVTADSRTVPPPSTASDFPPAHGNLSMPAAKPAAHRIATALSGRK